jgi:hypothetical protein
LDSCANSNYYSFYTAVKNKRTRFLSSMAVHRGRHEVTRLPLYEEIIELYRKNPQTMMEYPFTIRFSNEKGMDFGGVAQDMFSAFWECAYTAVFDGSSTLVPQVHPHIDMSVYPVLGTILSHGFLVTGILPVRLSFITIAVAIFGPEVYIADSICDST